MGAPIIEAERLAKRYRIGAHRDRYLSLREELVRKVRRIPAAVSRLAAGGGNGEAGGETDFWALDDVSFSVEEGEAIGVIGRNGAGKSTLLKILSRITPPTRGRVVLRGRVASLLEVGTGFHPELTGRENIYLNGAILGMTREEIRRKFDEIVAFSEVEQFLDTPVKRYSSGMYVRLAFAVAAHLEPEILLVDEVLAVGDAMFQKKCMGKMGSISREGRTVLFVSHNMAAVQNLCARSLLLAKGRIRAFGETGEVIGRYMEEGDRSGACASDLASHPNRRTGSETVLRGVRIIADGNDSTTMRMGGALRIETSFERSSGIPNMRFGIAIESSVGQRLVSFSPSHQAPLLLCGSIERGTIVCEIPCLRLMPGIYYITLIIGSGTADLDRIDQAVPFVVETSDVFRTGYAPESAHGVFYQDADWKVLRS